jgi:hypothetical protein
VTLGASARNNSPEENVISAPIASVDQIRFISP